MRILLCNNFYYRRGGDCTYMFALANLLREHDHEVVFFSMRHPKNLPCEQEKYFVDFIDYRAINQSKSAGNMLKVLRKSIYSPQAGKRIRALISDLKPDLAHLQNIHNHLTPAILPALRRAGIPVVWTLHDFKLVCPENSFLSGDRICEECKGGRFYRCTVNRCKKASLAASLLASLEAYAHQPLRIPKRVARFIAPSQFLRDKFVEFGWPAERLTVLPNFLPHVQRETPELGDYGIYLGQLRKIKGLFTLLEALEPDTPFHILGEGPEEATLKQRAQELGLRGTKFLGHLSGDDLEREMEGAAYGVLPSECYENLPFSVMELMALGKPVVGSRVGGIPELIRHDETGFLFEAGHPEDLAQKIRALLANKKRCRQMGNNARQIATEAFTPEKHYAELMPIYEQALHQKDKPSRDTSLDG